MTEETVDHAELVALHRRRAEAVAHAGLIQAAMDKIDALERDASDAEVRLREHDADLADQMREWALGDSGIEAPAGDTRARADLASAIAHAKARVSSAAQARTSLEDDYIGALAAVTEIGVLIENEAWIIALREHAAAVADVDDEIARLSPKLAKVLSLPFHLANVVQGLASATGPEQERRLRVIERLNSLPEIGRLKSADLLMPTVSEVHKQAMAWEARATELARAPLELSTQDSTP